MKNLFKKLLCINLFVFFLVNTSLAQTSETINCSLKNTNSISETRHRINNSDGKELMYVVLEGNFDCSSVKEAMENIISEGESATILNIEENKGYRYACRDKDNLGVCSINYYFGSGYGHVVNPRKSYEILAYKTDSLEEKSYDIPTSQQEPRPNINYYEPNIDEVESNVIDNKTFNLNNKVSKGASNRINNELEVSKFQFKKSSCNDNTETSVNLCYRTSTEGSVIKTGI